MKGKDLKQYIYDNGLIPQVLESIGCHNISFHDKYWTCGNSDGDNKKAISVYNTDFINVINYTRDITNKDKYTSDIISLVAYNQKLSPFEAIKFICGVVGIGYYHDFSEDVPESLKITQMIYELQDNSSVIDDDKPLKPISKKVLEYYKPYVNDLFFNDGIDYLTQQEFQIGYDPCSDRITIPIFSEIDDLIGVKGRIFKDKDELDEDDLKYIYIEPCNRSKVLYGLNKTYEYIQIAGKCFVGESEKFVMQLWSMGYYNSVGVGGKKVTSTQIDKLTRLGVDLVFCFDKDVSREELDSIASRFVDKVNIYCLIDKDNVLGDKESPSDSKEKFDYLVENCIYKIK